jgi:hypothetical protein
MAKERMRRFYFNSFREKLHSCARIYSTHSGKTSKDRDKEKKNKEFHLRSKSPSILASSDRWITMAIHRFKDHSPSCMHMHGMESIPSSKQRQIFFFFFFHTRSYSRIWMCFFHLVVGFQLNAGRAMESSEQMERNRKNSSSSSFSDVICLFRSCKNEFGIQVLQRDCHRHQQWSHDRSLVKYITNFSVFLI